MQSAATIRRRFSAVYEYATEFSSTLVGRQTPNRQTLLLSIFGIVPVLNLVFTGTNAGVNPFI